MQGDVIQPTAIHASFAYGPLFRAIDANEKLQQQRLQQLAAHVRLRMPFHDISEGVDMQIAVS